MKDALSPEAARLLAHLKPPALPSPESAARMDARFEALVTAPAVTASLLSAKTILTVLGVVSAVSLGTWAIVRSRPRVVASTTVAVSAHPAPKATTDRDVQPVLAPPLVLTLDASRPVATDVEPVTPRVATVRVRPRVMPEREDAFLLRAQQLVARDARAGLALVRTYPRRFPSGSLGEEASVIEIEALCRMADTNGCRNKGKQFLLQHPDGIHAARVRALMRGESP